MSAGHHHRSDLSQKDLDAILDKVLAQVRVREALKRPYKLDTDHDIALVGSSAIGGRVVYLDRHLHGRGLPFGVLLVKGRKLDTKAGLIRHERLEQICEDILKWKYDLSHVIAQHWEERDYKRRGFDPRQVEKAFKPFIKADEHERIVKTPVDLDMRPLLAPPKSTELIKYINEAAQKEKRPHSSVGYVSRSTTKSICAKCVHFIEARYGGPACVGVQSPINPQGYCRRFRAGELAGLRTPDPVKHPHHSKEQARHQ